MADTDDFAQEDDLIFTLRIRCENQALATVLAAPERA